LRRADMRGLRDHDRARENALARGGSPTDRVCPVHDWAGQQKL
jgi:hypothetical protein